MYLRATTRVSGYEHEHDAEKLRFCNVVTALGLHPDDVSPDVPSATVTICAAYWRKANAIHAWFVEHCQGGKDDCGTYPVDRNQLKELCALCTIILADKSKAAQLPPTAGFFFGSTAIDEGYFTDLADTVTQITALLNPRLEQYDFAYHSSW